MIEGPDASIQSDRLGDCCSMRRRSIFYHQYFITSICRQLVKKQLQLPGDDPLCDGFGPAGLEGVLVDLRRYVLEVLDFAN